MNNDYLTLNSKISIRNGWLNDKKLNYNSQEGFYRYTTFMLLTGMLIYLIHDLFDTNSYGNIVLIILTINWIWPLAKRLYRTLFILAWRTNIRTSEITGIQAVPMESGVETKAVLKLKNGRIKEIVFRNAENQLEPFMNDLSGQLSNSIALQS